MAQGREWTPDDDRQLRELVEGGLSFARVAVLLGRTRGAVCARAAKVGVRSQGAALTLAQEAQRAGATYRRVLHAQFRRTLAVDGALSAIEANSAAVFTSAGAAAVGRRWEAFERGAQAVVLAGAYADLMDAAVAAERARADG